MDASEETARRVEENDRTLHELYIGCDFPREDGNGAFMSYNSSDLAKLGESIGKNTRLFTVGIHGSNALPIASNSRMTRSYHSFCEGFKLNCSIGSLGLLEFDLSQGVGYELLKSFKENWAFRVNLEFFFINGCDLRNGGTRALASTLATLRYITCLAMVSSDVDDDDLVEILSASTAAQQNLEVVDLANNNIGMAGCDALATLLKNTTSNLSTLRMERNNLDDRCVNVLANALSSNCKLKRLCLGGNPQITGIGLGAFSRVLCNKNSVNDTYLSNHTLRELEVPELALGGDLRHSLKLNSGENKRLVAMRKIIQYHSRLDMEQFFEWGLKVLPLAVGWFDSAIDRLTSACISGQVGQVNIFDIESVRRRKLPVIYQFVRAMPLMCLPCSHGKGVKRMLRCS